jgi:hypothetical protein
MGLFGIVVSFIIVSPACGGLNYVLNSPQRPCVVHE